jgi:hypothetical protein
MEQIPCNPELECRYRDSKLGCRADVHHLFFPANLYKQGLAKTFRELECNKVRECRNLHDLEHHVFQEPDMPSRETMQAAVERERTKRLNGLT